MSGYLKPGCFFILLKNCVPDKKDGMTSVTHPSAFAGSGRQRPRLRNGHSICCSQNFKMFKVRYTL